MIPLTDEQRQALRAEELPRLVDPETQQAYVLIRADVFERMRAVIDGISRRAGWEDPKLDEYERYRKKS